jgi:hypothetical protein
MGEFFCCTLYLPAVHPRGRGGVMQFCFVSSTRGPTNLGSGKHIYIFIYGGQVCGRYADGAHLMQASVTASTSMVGSHSKLPRSVIILINGQLFSLGSRVCTSILHPAVLALHKLSLPLSHVYSSCSHVVKSYKPRSAHMPWKQHSVSKAGCTTMYMRQ